MKTVYLASLLATAVLSPLVIPHSMAQETESAPAKEEAARRLLNVKEYGAKGDGQTDDTAAFESVLKELAPSGGVLFIPEGNYRITRRLSVSGSHPKADRALNYIEIAGAGRNATRLLGDGVDYIIGAASHINQKTKKRTWVNGFSIHNVTLAPFAPKEKVVCGGIDTSYMIRWSVRDCHFVGLKTGVFSLQQSQMEKEDTPDSLAVFIIRIQNNLFYGCRDYAIKLGRIFDLSIENNEIEHGVGGIMIGQTGDGFDAAANTIRIVNNVIEGLGWGAPAISGSCWIGAQVVGNYFEANLGGDVELVSGPKDGWGRGITIAANTFQPAKHQREGEYGPIKLVKVLDTTITGNFTTGSNLLHPESASIGQGVNLISNTLNNPPEIGDIVGASAGNPADYLGQLSEGSLHQAEQWAVKGPLGSVGIHSLHGLRFQPRGQKVRAIAYASAPPADAGIHREAGDLLLNLTPTLSKENKVLFGWVCIASGKPGQWQPLWLDTTTK